MISNHVIPGCLNPHWDPFSSAGVLFNTLPAGSQDGAAPLTSVEQLPDFITPAFQEIDWYLHSAWLEHIPFLFCLMDYVRPRRYVELGTHNGASFFGACQAAKALDPGIECIAIDLWEGDVHAGRYGGEVFEQFARILKEEFPTCGRYLKMDFNDAVHQFEPGSIDLLHIDGLHTYEAVKNDYETWRTKLSASGIMMFHDTQVFERDFGVHRLWSELRDQYPSFEFAHGFGLGLIYVGSETDSRAAAFFKLAQQEGIQSFLHRCFSPAGPRHRLAEKQRTRNQQRLADLARLQRDACRLRAELDKSHAEAGCLRAELEKRLDQTNHLQVELAQRSAQLEQRDAELAQRSAELAQRSDEAQRLHSTAEQNLAEANGLRNALDIVQAEANGLRTEVAQGQAQTHSLMVDRENLQTEMAHLQGLYASAQQEIDQLRREKEIVIRSKSFKVAQRMSRVRGVVAPEGTSRFWIFKKMVGAVKVWRARGMRGLTSKVIKKTFLLN